MLWNACRFFSYTIQLYVSPAEDRSLLVILLEAHQGLWSQLNAETTGAEDARHLTLHGFFQQVLPQ